MKGIDIAASALRSPRPLFASSAIAFKNRGDAVVIIGSHFLSELLLRIMTRNAAVSKIVVFAVFRISKTF